MFEHATRLGIAEDEAAYLLSIVGASNAVGRLFAGWIADRRGLDAVALHIGALVAAGAATCCVPLLSSYELLCVYEVVFGLCMGTSSSSANAQKKNFTYLCRIWTEISLS